jgi:hypothetical protein
VGGARGWKLCNPRASAADDEALIAATPWFDSSYAIKTGPTTFKIKRRGGMCRSVTARRCWSSMQGEVRLARTASAEQLRVSDVRRDVPHVGMSPELRPEMTFRIGIRRKLELIGKGALGGAGDHSCWGGVCCPHPW